MSIGTLFIFKVIFNNLKLFYKNGIRKAISYLKIIKICYYIRMKILDKNIIGRGIIDLHMHSTISDGTLHLEELVEVAMDRGYSAMAFTDHVFFDNYKRIADKIINWVDKNQEHYKDIVLIPGVEITFATPKEIGIITKDVRAMGSKCVVVHGEASFERTPKGTNDAAIEHGVNVLAHPSYITKEQVVASLKTGTAFELSARDCYNYANKQIAETVLQNGGKMVINSDSHQIGAMLSKHKVLETAKIANLTEEQLSNLKNDTVDIVHKILSDW